MHRYQEGDIEDDRKPGGKTLKIKSDMESVGLLGGGRIGQEKVEERKSNPFRRPQKIGKAGEVSVIKSEIVPSFQMTRI